MQIPAPASTLNMATINQFITRTAFTFGLAATACLLSTNVAWRVWRWWSYRPLERVTGSLLNMFDQKLLDLNEVIEGIRLDNAEELVYDEESGELVITKPAKKLRFRAKPQQVMAYALADVGYLKFGFRPDSEAYRMITRKYLLDVLSEFKDLRAHDAGEILDVAVPMSFLPSKTFQDMTLMKTTATWRDRAQADKQFYFWRLFRKFQKIGRDLFDA